MTSIPALAATLTSFVETVDALEVTSIVLFVTRDIEPTEAVTELPLAETEAVAVTVTDEVDAVTAFPVTDAPAAAATETEPTEAVVLAIASSALPQVLSPQAILLEDHP